MLDPQTKKQVVMIFKEAMNNTAKHAKASQVTLALEYDKQEAEISLIDNGSGFDVTKDVKGRGLNNQKDRSWKIGATLDISSNSSGTEIRLRHIPIMGYNKSGNKS